MNEHNENEIPEEVEVPETFRVVDDKSAEWVLRKIRESDDAIERAKAWAADIEKKETKKKQWFLDRFKPELEAYSRQQLEGKKSQSFKLPSGTLGFRKTTPQLKVTDENEYSKWVETNLPTALRTEMEADVSRLTPQQRDQLKIAMDMQGVLVKIESTVLKSVVNDHFKESGEVPAGCDVVAEGDKFYVK